MRDIPGYEGLYAATSCGKIWSHKRKKFLRPFIVGSGYFCVKLCKNGKSLNHRIHRLIALTYLPNPDNLPEINHINEVKTDNYLNNLEWCDRKYNINYGNRTKRQIETRVGNYKIACYKKKTNEFVGYFASQSEAARELNLWQGNITKAVRGLLKSTGGYTFQYVKIDD